MKQAIKPWAKKAFELIFHAEHHWRRGMDYDKRLALISFDNSIEVSISVYLSLDPIQRNNKHYEQKDVKTWLHNYYSRLDFLALELKGRGLPEHRDKAHIVYLHKQRNELYHGSTGGVPEVSTLEEIRFVSLWIYSVLFDDPDIEMHLAEAIESAGSSESVMPDFGVVPDLHEADIVNGLDVDSTNVLLVAALIGGWDETNESDKEMIGRLANEV